MPFKIKDGGGTLRTAISLKSLDGGALRTIRTMKVMDEDDTTLRTVAAFAPALTLSISPSPVSDSGYDSNVRSAYGTATPSGGLGPYTYSWAKLSGTTMTLSASTSATTLFSSPLLGVDEEVTASYRCTCTDAIGQTATADVDVYFLFFNPF